MNKTTNQTVPSWQVLSAWLRIVYRSATLRGTEVFVCDDRFVGDVRYGTLAEVQQQYSNAHSGR